MPRLEEYVVHCEDGRHLLFLSALCGKVEGETDLVVGAGTFHMRAGGVCRDCASSEKWKILEAQFLKWKKV